MSLFLHQTLLSYHSLESLIYHSLEWSFQIYVIYACLSGAVSPQGRHNISVRIMSIFVLCKQCKPRSEGFRNDSLIKVCTVITYYMSSQGLYFVPENSFYNFICQLHCFTVTFPSTVRVSLTIYSSSYFLNKHNKSI